MNKRSNELNDKQLGSVSGGRISQMSDGEYIVLADKEDSDGQIKVIGYTSSKFKAKHIAKKHRVSTDGI